MSRTKLKKLHIEKFRALRNVAVDFGDHITVVCGKNGTSKSSILGIAAQIFSFEKDYVKQKALPYREIAGGDFKSQYSDHIRISEKFDVPGSMDVNIELFDGYTGSDATAKLVLMSRGRAPRPVVRKNSTAAGGNASRNFTHPVIFLSLKRLFPIANRSYKVIDFDYLERHKQQFIALTNELLNRTASHATGTGGTISSAVSHGDNYDQESVSAGEDNAGQIVMALMSFKKLEEEYPDYKGGLLLIDEADAGLFPTAQENLFRMLERYCKELSLQVIMTTHSPVLIEYAYEQSQKFRHRFKTVYLSGTYGSVQVMQDWSWRQISADINTRTVSSKPGESLPKVNVYFEDREAADFYSALVMRQPFKKFTVTMSDLTLGSSNYLQLIKKGVPEFSERSVVCLDADQANSVAGKKYNTVVLLPGHLPPDQLIFEHLYNLPPDDPFWDNEIQFTRDVFTNAAREVLSVFSISGQSVDVQTSVDTYQGGKKPREVFKRFYKNDEIQKLITSGEKAYNPWKHWVGCNPASCNQFLEELKGTLRRVMKNGYAVGEDKLASLSVRLKKT